MGKTKIEWTDYTINPIKGLCKSDCWYCYAKKFYKRFNWNTEVRLDLSVFDTIPKDAKRVFVCSTHDIFGDWIPDEWILRIIEECGKKPHMTFQILTKLPRNIDMRLPNNVWIGASVCYLRDIQRISILTRCVVSPLFKNNIKFISFEPLLESMWLLRQYLYKLKEFRPDWIIIGRLTGHGKKHDPKREWIENIVLGAKRLNIPVFLKDNLQEIWGEPLIREFPDLL